MGEVWWEYLKSDVGVTLKSVEKAVIRAWGLVKIPNFNFHFTAV